MKLDDLVSTYVSPTITYIGFNISSMLMNVPTAMNGQFDLLYLGEKVTLVGFLIWDKFQQRKDYEKLLKEYKEEEERIRKEAADREAKLQEQHRLAIADKDREIRELNAKLLDFYRQAIQTTKT